MGLFRSRSLFAFLALFCLLLSSAWGISPSKYRHNTQGIPGRRENAKKEAAVPSLSLSTHDAFASELDLFARNRPTTNNIGFNFDTNSRRDMFPGTAHGRLFSFSTPATIAVVFALLIFRLSEVQQLHDLRLSEFANTISRTLSRLLLLADVLALGVSLWRPIALKSLLKVVLALNSLREMFGAAVNIFFLVMGSKDWGRREHLVQLVLNFWWMLLSVSVRKSRWANQLAHTNHNN